jgi:hypothetical protein
MQTKLLRFYTKCATESASLQIDPTPLHLHFRILLRPGCLKRTLQVTSSVPFHRNKLFSFYRRSFPPRRSYPKAKAKVQLSRRRAMDDPLRKTTKWRERGNHITRIAAIDAYCCGHRGGEDSRCQRRRSCKAYAAEQCSEPKDRSPRDEGPTQARI